MSNKKTWISTDKKIQKEILESGIYGAKPTDNCICTIEITSVQFKTNSMPSEFIVDVSKYPLRRINIGESNTAIDREIEKCLGTMLKEELSSVRISLMDNEVSFVLKLYDFEFRGYIYEWDAKQKCLIAEKHKEKGIELFKENRFKDASHRFSRGLKLVLSIPVPIDETPEKIDGVTLEDINKLKANLYNNLASCYNKEKIFNIVIELCTKVLEMDQENQEALHERGFAYAETRNFEEARDDLKKLLSLNPENNAAKNKLQLVHLNISEQEANFDSMVKKMFRT